MQLKQRQKIKREGIKGQINANNAHLKVGKKVRETIKELGGTMPENLPTFEHIKEAKKRLKQLEQNVDLGKIELEDITKFSLPNEINKINELIDILKNLKGDIRVRIGEKIYSTSLEGFNKIHNLLK